MDWSDSRVLKAGANGTSDKLYVWLKDNEGKHDCYFELEPTLKNQLLATALTALSLDLPVDAYVGQEGDPKNPEYFYCYALYVRRE